MWNRCTVHQRRFGALSVVLLLAPVLLNGCGAKNAVFPVGFPGAASFSSEVPRAWMQLALRLTQETPGFTPPVASRAFGYEGVALYEAIVPGMHGYVSLAGQLNGLSSVPAATHGYEYHWPLVANSALAAMFRELYSNATPANMAAIDSLEAAFEAIYQVDVETSIKNRSVSRGRAVADAIFAWAMTDGGHEGQLSNFPASFVPPVGPGLWVPTPQLSGAPPQSALQPYWGDNRPFVLDPGGDPTIDCDPGVPPAYSEDPASDFYVEALEVYETVNNATAEEVAIALFWADDPGVTATPPGHSLSILRQTLADEDASLALAAEGYSKVGIAVADAFIACWYSKFVFNLLRPITYARTVLGDPTWLPPHVNTPPFPEYTSGHSVQSGAVFQVLTDMFGEDYPFTDHTHDARGLASRSFASFNDAAEEAAISRLYGGIHYRAAIDKGVLQGRLIASEIAALTFHAGS